LFLDGVYGVVVWVGVGGGDGSEGLFDGEDVEVGG